MSSLINDYYGKWPNGEIYYVRPSWRFLLEYLAQVICLVVIFVTEFLGFLFCVHRLINGFSGKEQNFAEQAGRVVRTLLGYIETHPEVAVYRDVTVIFLFVVEIALIYITLRALFRIFWQIGVRYQVGDGNFWVEGHFFKRLNHRFKGSEIIGLTIRQSWLGRKLNYGTIIWYLKDKIYKWPRIADFSDFCENILSDDDERAVQFALSDKRDQKRYRARPLGKMFIIMSVCLLFLVFLLLVMAQLMVLYAYGPLSRMFFIGLTAWILYYVCSRAARAIGVRYSIANGICERDYRLGGRVKDRFLLEQVGTVKVRRGLLGRLLNYGRVIWYLGDTRRPVKKFKWRFVPNVTKIGNDILSTINEA